MTSLADPDLKALSVCEIPREYFPDFVTRLRLLMIDSRALVKFLRPISKQKAGQNRPNDRFLKNSYRLICYVK